MMVLSSNTLHFNYCDIFQLMRGSDTISVCLWENTRLRRQSEKFNLSHQHLINFNKPWNSTINSYSIAAPIPINLQHPQNQTDTQQQHFLPLQQLLFRLIKHKIKRITDHQTTGFGTLIAFRTKTAPLQQLQHVSITAQWFLERLYY